MKRQNKIMLICAMILVFMMSAAMFSVLGANEVPVDEGEFVTVGDKLYYTVDGEKIGGWFVHGGKTYYASSATNVVINYDKKIQGKYYLWNDETGLEIADGFVTDENGTKCYEDGINVIGWRHADGSGPKVVNGISEQYSSNPENLYYFLSTTGYMVTEPTYKLGGYIREFDEDHTVKAMNGLQTNGGELYYYVDGVKQTGWHTIDGTTYYFRASDAVYGRAATKWMYIGNKVYYFYASTSATPYALKDSGAIGGITYTYHEDGYILYNGFVNCDYANAANSNTAANIQKKNGTTRYYVDGEMQTGWQQVNGDWYYFYAIGSSMGSGYMCTESRTIGGVYYEFTESGKCPNFVCRHTSKVTVAGYEPTCTEEGLTDGVSCGICKEILVPQNVISPLGHTEVTDNAVAPTCTETGLTEGSHCGVCGDVLVGQNTVAALGHTEVTDKAVDPTCTETGLTEGSHCGVCGDVLVPQNTVAALGHSEVTDKAVEPTCTETGLTAGIHCGVCGDILVRQVTVSALGHTEGDWKIIKEATKTEDGILGLLCVRCDYVFEEKVIVAGSQGLAYSVNEDKVTCTVTGIGSCEDTEIVIPRSINGYTVTAIGDRAFVSCTNITRVVIPKTVKTIGQGAFNVCNKLESVVIPEGVTEIGASAFSGCSSLKSIVIPDSVTYIGGAVLSGCSSLESVVLPFVGDRIKTNTETYQYPFGYIFGSASYEGGKAATQKFYGEKLSYDTSSTYYIPLSLKYVKINGGNVNYGAFYNCSMISEIVLGDEVQRVERLAFYSCSSLKKVIIPESVTFIGIDIFRGCTSLETIVLPFIGDSLRDSTSTTQYSLWYLFNSTGSSTNIPQTIKSVTVFGGCIFNGAFGSCSSIEEIILGDNVTSIGDYAFNSCSKLKKINIPDGITYIGIEAFSLCSNLKTVIIPSSVTTIGKKAFYFSGIESIVIPDSVTSMGEYCFSNCASLKEITLGNSITVIGKYAFQSCSKLGRIVIPNSVTTIDGYAFYNCSNLTSVVLGASVTTVQSYAFSGCSKLVEIYDLSPSVTVTKGDSWSLGGIGTNALAVHTSLDVASRVWADSDGYMFYMDENANYLIGYSGNDTRLVLPTHSNIGEYKIYKYAFYTMKDITGVEIPNCVTAIGERAFASCTSLKNVTISNGLTEIGTYAFASCSSIEELVIPDSVTVIGASALTGCSSLKKLTVPFVGNVAGTQSASTKTLFGFIFGIYSFTNSYSASQNYTSRYNTTYYIPMSLTDVTVTGGGKLMYGAFSDCRYITSIALGEGVTEIGGEAFSNTGITSLIIPESVTSIEGYAFEGSPITELVIPGSVTTVVDNTFSGCSKLETIVFSEGVTSIGRGGYSGFGDALIKIVIPVSVKEISGYAFSSCTVLEMIVYNGTEEQWNSITKGSDWDYNTGDYTVYFSEE
ncbi:MAG: hypothetical protein E7675_03395 [Ruminococcaceae bacterium]|nr:hypothetical protein [Oscillospiraceae bacterium]